MGGGGLRILGHKKWHVWRRDNIERVLRDEREHAEQQRLERDEQRRRDQEVRADALGQAHEQPPSSAVSHINFFEKEEEAHTLALLTGGERAETGKRRREQQPSETLGRQARLPWYATATTHEDEANSRHGHKRKRVVESQDPLRAMRPPRDAAERDADDDEDERVRRRRDETRQRRINSEEKAPKKKKEKKKKKQAKHEKKPRHDDGGREAASDMILRLRRERKEREAIERDRAERLMRGQ